jgi:hypothetical protein
VNAKSRLFTLIAVLAIVLTLLPPLVSADAPPTAPQLPGGVTVSQTYIDAVTYWYKQVFPQDWATRVSWALNPTKATSNGLQSAHVVLMGVPANTWWINAWRMEFSGSWTSGTSGWSFHPVGQAPGPVGGDLAIQGYLPGVYIVRACDKTGAVLVNGPRLMVVSRTTGTAQTFDLNALPAPTTDQLAGVTM